jgi:hypothetical protein
VLFVQPALLIAVIDALVILRVPPAAAHYWDDVTILMHNWGDVTVLIAFVMPLFLFFAVARRENGFAGLHELISGTRVVLDQSKKRRLTGLTTAATTPIDVPREVPRLGPYVLLKDAEMHAPRLFRIGYDERLQRHVWIHVRPPDSPPVAADRRDLDRPARLRWLGGSYSEDEAWDAYEAVGGQPLASVGRQPWSVVREWLQIVADEVRSSLADGSLSDLSVDCVWIGADGRIRLLEWPVTGSHEGDSGDGKQVADFGRVQTFLCQLAITSLEGRAVALDERRVPQAEPRLPLGAASFFQSLADKQFATADELFIKVASLISRPAVTSRQTRLAHLAACAAGVLAFGMNVLAINRAAEQLPPMRLADLQSQSTHPTAAHPIVTQSTPLTLRLYLLVVCLQDLNRINTRINKQVGWRVYEGQWYSPEGEAELREALEIFLRGRLRETMQDALRSTEPYTWQLHRGPLLSLAKEVFRGRSPLPEDLARAEVVLNPILGRKWRGLYYFLPFARIDYEHRDARYQPLPPERPSPERLYGQLALLSVLTLALAIFLPAMLHGGWLLGLLDLGVVNHDGMKASRLRACCRAAIAWLPILLFYVFTDGQFLRASPFPHPFYSLADLFGDWNESVALCGLAIFAAGGIWAMYRPARGIQDWLAGTWIVPR